jgi:hypothetical protein
MFRIIGKTVHWNPTACAGLEFIQIVADRFNGNITS